MSAIVFAAVLGGGLLVIKGFWPVSKRPSLPALVPVPALQAITRSSIIVAPIAVTRSAIRNALEAQAPRNVSGKQVNSLSQLLTSADVGWSVDRGPLALTDRNGEIEIATELSGALHIRGAISAITDDLVGTLGGLFNQNLGQALQQLTGTVIDQNVEFHGNLRVTFPPFHYRKLAARTKLD